MKKFANVAAAPWPWELSGQARMVVDGKHAKLVLVAEDAGSQGWLVMAIQTPMKKYKNMLKEADAVLDNHSHQVLGTHPTIAHAMAAAEAFAGAWLAKNGTTLQKRCHCGPILNPTFGDGPLIDSTNPTPVARAPRAIRR